MLSATDTGACDLRYRGSVVGLHKRRDITGIGLRGAHKRARMLWNTMLQQRTWRRCLTWWAKTTLRQRSTLYAAAAQARRGRANCKLQHAHYKKQQRKIVMQTTPRALTVKPQAAPHVSGCVEDRGDTRCAEAETNEVDFFEGLGGGSSSDDALD